ncbi:MAG TPA: ABC transporter permease, partial [Lachnospiraceae bacterium]|nr:ABC transporter permease [Lachnospiraceae bacterium]
MTFKDVAIKNFKENLRNYSAYFLCNCFTIMLFFMYAILMFNRAMTRNEQLDALRYIFPITIVAIGLFSIFFINYAHRTFIKGRNKEFGIYMSLGMTERDIRRLVNIENIIISISSFLVGILVGLLFSRLFQMVIIHMLGVKNITYQLSYKAFLVTIGVYVVIFSIVFLDTNIRLKRMDIGMLLKESRKGEGKSNPRKDRILGTVGILSMAFSVFLVMTIATNDRLNSNPILLIIYMLVSFLGVYLVLAYGGNMVIARVKRSRFYLRNLIAITQIHYKFSQNKKIIFILSILSSMTIFLVASPFSLLNLTKDIAEMDPYHLEFVRSDTENQISEETLDRILSSANVVSKNILTFLTTDIAENGKSVKQSPIMPQSEYNAYVKKDITIPEGEAIYFILDWTPGNHGIAQGMDYIVSRGDSRLKIKVAESKRMDWTTTTFGSDGLLVMNDKDYEVFRSNAKAQELNYFYTICFHNWEDSKDEILSLKENLGESKQYVLDATILRYASMKKAYSVFLFVTSLLGVLFFVASGSVLYFKQYTEMDETKRTFYRLYKIGITRKEISSIIRNELLVIFYLPLLFGSFIGVSLIYLMTYIVGGDGIIVEFIQTAFKLIGVYFVLQSIFYFITKRKYM